MQHRQGPTAGSWTSVPPDGVEEVGSGPPVEKSNEGYEYGAERPVREMTRPGTLFQSEHENVRAMSDVHSEIPACEYARAMSKTRDMRLTSETMPTSPENTNETISTCARATMCKLPQTSHPETKSRAATSGTGSPAGTTSIPENPGTSPP